MSGLCGALAGAFVPVAFALAAPPQRICCQGLHGVNWATGRQSPLYLDSIWTPQIDRDAKPRGLARACRIAPRASVEVADSPLPNVFDPRGVPRESFYACILVSPGGDVAAVRLIGGSGSAAVDAEVGRTIREEWRFDIRGGGAEWIRVRLDAPADVQLSVRPAPLALY